MEKILCITSDPISLNNPNGKFIRNYLHSFDDNELANFYISTNEKDNQIDSFNVTDKIALLSIYKRKTKLVKKISENKIDNSIRKQKNAFKHICRYLVWNLGFWKKTGFSSWLNSIQVKHLVVPITDNPYLLKLSRKIAKCKKIDITLFIGENYPIKNYDYLKQKNKMGLFYRFFKKLMMHQTAKILNEAKCTIFNSDLIKEQYINTKSFKIKKFFVFYPPADVIEVKKRKIDFYSILYAGNLGVGRLEKLLEFSNEIYRFDKNFKIYVYSKLDSKLILKLQYANNIQYMGYVNNDKLNQILLNSNILLHIESDSEYYKKDLETAFSTKIANNIVYGNNFLLYAPQCLAESSFFVKYCPENYVYKKEDIIPAFIKILKNGSKINKEVFSVLNIKKTSELIRNLIVE